MDIETLKIGDTVFLRDGREAVIDSISLGWVEGYEDKREDLIVTTDGEILPVTEVRGAIDFSRLDSPLLFGM